MDFSTIFNLLLGGMVFCLSFVIFSAITYPLFRLLYGMFFQNNNAFFTRKYFKSSWKRGKSIIKMYIICFIIALLAIILQYTIYSQSLIS